MAPVVAQTVTTDIPWGVIVPSVVAGVAIVLYFILALIGKAPGVKVQTKDKLLGISPHGNHSKTSVGSFGKRDVDIKSVQLVQLVSKRRYEMLNTAWARHTAAISSVIEDQFFPIFPSVQDRWQIMTAWERFGTVLRDIVNFNHIIEEVYSYSTSGNRAVNQEYLDEKLRVFRIRYLKLLSWPGNTLPEFLQMEPPIRQLMLDVLEKFHEISAEEQEKLVEFVNLVKQTTDNPDLISLLDTVSEVQSSDAVSRLVL